MAGKRGGFLSKLLGEDSSKPPLTDADRDAWLRPGAGERGGAGFGASAAGGAPSWGGPAAAEAETESRPAGVDITEMSPDSPLGRAGIEEGDVITAVNGRSTPTETSLADALNRLGPGERARVSVLRDDDELTITVIAPG